MSDPRGGVKNAADEEQVKEAGVRAQDRRTTELSDLKKLLAMPEGRRFFWRMFGHCGLYREPVSDRERGIQAIAHFLLGEITSADERSWLTMQEEALRRGELKNG